MKFILFCLSIAFLSGCASAKLTPAGMNSKLVESDFIKADKCKTIDTIMYSNEMKFGGANRTVVIGDLRNKVGEMGGNVGTTSYDMRGVYDPAAGAYIIPIGSRIPLKVYTCEGSFFSSLITM